MGGGIPRPAFHAFSKQPHAASRQTAVNYEEQMVSNRVSYNPGENRLYDVNTAGAHT